MNISQIYNLNKTQFELDFVDVDIERDLSVFVDPKLLSLNNDSWSISANRTLVSFFTHFIELMRAGQHQEARQLFSHFSEPNETCLGMSRGRPKGLGIGDFDADKLFESIANSRAIQTGLIDDLDDFRFFIDGIGRDKISDMTTNIIRGHLVEYTKNQCNLWGIPLQVGVDTGIFWDRARSVWTSQYDEMLIIDDRKILLMPKVAVSFSKKYTARRFYNMYLLSFKQREYLQQGGPLIQFRERSGAPYVTKKDLEPIVDGDKESLLEFAERHPDIFSRFKSDLKGESTTISNADLDPTVSVEEVARYLMNELETTATGAANANYFHKLVVGILELLFFPNLTAPQVEREINDGRKRIDLTFDNSAKHGFFYELHDRDQIPCQYIFIECKNYSRDIANPEVDQLIARLSPNRGKFGMMVCRSVEDTDRLTARCRDAYRDRAELLLFLTDEDLQNALERLLGGDDQEIYRILTDRKRDVILG